MYTVFNIYENYRGIALIAVYDIMQKPVKLLYIYNTEQLYKIDEHAKYGDTDAQVSPDGRILIYRNNKNNMYLVNFDSEYNVLSTQTFIDPDVAHSFLGSCWSSAFRFLAPEIATIISEEMELSVIYRNLKTGDLKLMDMYAIDYGELNVVYGVIEDKITTYELYNDFTMNGNGEYPYTKCLPNPNPGKYFDVQMFYNSIDGCCGIEEIHRYYTKNKAKLTQFKDITDIFQLILNYDIQLGNKYQITNDGISVFVIIRYNNKDYKIDLVPKDKY